MPTTTGCLTDFAEQKLLDHVVNNTAWTLPTCYFGLLIATPTDAGGTEITTPGTNGYARIAVGTGGSCKFNAAASRSTSTNATLTFGPSTGGPWSTVAYWGMWDASTGGNLIAYGDITDGSVTTGDYYEIASGSITLTWTATSTTNWTDTTVNAWLDHVTGRTSYTSPATWVALFNGDPLGAGTEITTAGTNGYSRQDLDAALSAASGGSITNGSAITFGAFTAALGTCDYVAIYDASTAGTKLGGKALLTSKTLANGDSARFSASALTFTMN